MFARAFARRLPVLANRSFRLLLADRLLAPMAATFSLVGVSFAVLDLTGSTADLSYVLAAQLGPSAVFALIGGALADRMPPQTVIIAANLMVAVGDGVFGIVALAGHPSLALMIGLQVLSGTGIAVFYPASMALLPRLVPADQMQSASAISRLVMNAAMIAGAALAGFCVAGFGPGWALVGCGAGMLGTVPLLLAIVVRPLDGVPDRAPSMLRELREGWSEFRSHTWLWALALQFCVVLAAWCGGFQVLGPAVAKAHLGGAAAWGLITSVESGGLVVGGLVSLRWTPRRPLRFVALSGAAIAVSPLSLAMLLPLPVICVTAFALGVAIEMMSVIWTVTMAAKIRPEMLARVSAYEGLSSMMGMPVGAVVTGPIAAAVGVQATQYGAVAIIVMASALALIPRDVRHLRAGQPDRPGGPPAQVSAQAARTPSPVNASQSAA
jgi:predicted MFS family arabinose efflux permease